MLPAFLMALREGLEIALIVGILLGTLRKTGRVELRPAVWYGVGAAVLVSVLVALVLNSLGAALEGRAEQIFEGSLMLAAAGLLTWMIFWMQRQARRLRGDIESGIQQALAGSGRWALFWLAFFTIIREGIELALFLAATALAGSERGTVVGAVVGLAAAAMLGWAMFAAVLRLNLRAFFQITGALLILCAAGLVAHGVHEFNEARLIPTVIDPLWNLNAWLDENALPGALLAALFGYNGDPSLTEALAYTGYLAAVLAALQIGRLRSRTLLPGPKPPPVPQRN